MKKTIFILAILISLFFIVSCSNEPKSAITGAVSGIEEQDSETNLNSDFSQENSQINNKGETIISNNITSNKVESSNDNQDEIIEKKKEVLDLVMSSNYDKLRISILLNDINDEDSINAWNKLQRCIDCDTHATLKQGFIDAIEISMTNT